MATLGGKPTTSPLMDQAILQDSLGGGGGFGDARLGIGPGLGGTNFPTAISTGSGGATSSAASSSTPTLMPVLDDPRLGGLFGQAQSAIPTDLTSLTQFIASGMNSPLLQQILGPALARLMGTEQVSRDAVTDAARAAGSLRGTAYGQSFARNEQNIMQNRANLLSDTIAKTLSTLVPGLLQEQQNQFLPAKAMTDLLQASRPIAGDVRSAVESKSASGGGGGGGGGLTGFGNIWDNPNSGFYRGNANVRPGNDFSGGARAPTVPTPYYDPFEGFGGSNISNPWGGTGAPQHDYGAWQPISEPRSLELDVGLYNPPTPAYSGGGATDYWGGGATDYWEPEY